MKYKIIFIISFIVCVFPWSASAAVANIDKIVFVNEPQTVLPDQISKTFTIQTQNASGVLETIDETSDLEVSVDSPTGQFNSNNTTWNPTDTFTMSKNTGNKNFYYKDSTIGTYTIKATLTTRTSGKSFTTSQTLKIGTVLVDDTDNISESVTSTTTATSTTNQNNTLMGGDVTNISTHYIQEAVSSYVEPTNIFELSAGRNRLGYVGLPISLSAKHKISQGLEHTKCRYLWSFGDGSTGTGEELEHLYKYAGDYNLVINGECGDLRSVSRAKIKILEPSLSLTLMPDGAVAINNDGEYEMNLYGAKFLSDTVVYSFPLDTIIDPKNKIIFSPEYTGISNTKNIKLLDISDKPLAVLADSTDMPNTVVISTDELERFLYNYKQLTSSSL